MRSSSAWAWRAFSESVGIWGAALGAAGVAGSGVVTTAGFCASAVAASSSREQKVLLMGSLLEAELGSVAALNFASADEHRAAIHIEHFPGHEPGAFGA